MKISNSKKELARIISENGGWRDGDYASQHGGHGGIGFSLTKPWRCGDTGWDAGGSFVSKIEYKKPIKNWHQTILSREEYFHLYQAPDADGWIEWNGGECPVKRGALVDVKYANGVTNYGVSALTDKTSSDHVSGSAGSLLATNWSSGLQMSGIIAYRLHKPEQAKPKYCESVMRSIPEPSDKPTIEQLAADYRSAKDFADRKQEEVDAAKADAEAKLAELVAAGKALGLVLSVADTGPELVINDWRDLRERDVIWFCVDNELGEGEYSVLEVGGLDYGGQRAVRIDTIGNDYWIDVSDDWRFILRP